MLASQDVQHVSATLGRVVQHIVSIDDVFLVARKQSCCQGIEEPRSRPQNRSTEKNRTHDVVRRPSFIFSKWFLPSVGHSASASSKPDLRPSAMPCAIILTMVSASSLESRFRDAHEFRIRRARVKSLSTKGNLIGIFAMLQPRLSLIYHSLNGARYAFARGNRGFREPTAFPRTYGISTE
jgi:hypothetical protein